MVNEENMFFYNVALTKYDYKEILKTMPSDEIRLISIEQIDTMRYILQHFPILKIDPKLDNSMIYTNHYIEDFKMPYPAFFIDKAFETEAGIIAGIYIYDRLEILKLLLEEAITDNKKEYNYIDYLKESIAELPINDLKIKTSICCDVVNDISHELLSSSIDSILHRSIVRSNVLSQQKALSKHEVKLILNERLKYAIGIANLITSGVDLDYPQNPKQDIRIIPYYPDKKNIPSKGNNHSIIRVFGKLRKDLDHFNIEIRKRCNCNIDAVIVRGHWRHFRDDKFKNKKGQAIWIMPFVRGNDRELVSRVIEIKE